MLVMKLYLIFGIILKLNLDISESTQSYTGYRYG